MKNITFKKVKVGYRNFEGRELTYNPKGHRNFMIFLTEEQAEIAKKHGLHVRRTGESDYAYGLIIKLIYPEFVKDGVYPKIYAKIRGIKTPIEFDDKSVGFLDYIKVFNADVTLNIVSVMNSHTKEEHKMPYLSKAMVRISSKMDTKKAIMYAFGGNLSCKKEE